MAKLLTPLNIGALDLCHRAVFPGTAVGPRDGLHPLSLRSYYARQASPGGLIISHPLAVAGSRDPQPGGVGRHNEAHWFAALGAVHDAGGFILAQLVACALPGTPLDLPRPLDLIDDYRRAALEARRAGFDGVELNLVGARPLAHLPQPDRIALLLDVLDGLIADWAADRVGLRLCHGRDGLGRNDVSPLDLCEAVLRAVNERQVAYVHLAGRGACPGPALYGAAGARRLRTAIAWPLLVSGPFTPLAGLAAVESRWADAVGFESVEDALPLLAALRSAAGEG